MAAVSQESTSEFFTEPAKQRVETDWPEALRAEALEVLNVICITESLLPPLAPQLKIRTQAVFSTPYSYILYKNKLCEQFPNVSIEAPHLLIAYDIIQKTFGPEFLRLGIRDDLATIPDLDKSDRPLVSHGFLTLNSSTGVRFLFDPHKRGVSNRRLPVQVIFVSGGTLLE